MDSLNFTGNSFPYIFELMDRYPLSYLIFVIIGVFALYGIINKINSVWKSKAAVRIRKMLGDKMAVIYYIILCIFLIFFGIIKAF